MAQGRYEESSKTFGALSNAAGTQISRWQDFIKQAESQLMSGQLPPSEADVLQGKVEQMKLSFMHLLPMLASWYHDYAKSLDMCGHTLDAQTAYAKAAETIEQLPKEEAAKFTHAISINRAMMYEHLGNYKVAAPYHVQILRNGVEATRFDSPHVATMLNPVNTLNNTADERKKMEDLLDKHSPGWRDDVGHRSQPNSLDQVMQPVQNIDPATSPPSTPFAGREHAPDAPQPLKSQPEPQQATSPSYIEQSQEEELEEAILTELQNISSEDRSHELVRSADTDARDLKLAKLLATSIPGSEKDEYTDEELRLLVATFRDAQEYFKAYDEKYKDVDPSLRPPDVRKMSNEELQSRTFLAMLKFQARQEIELVNAMFKSHLENLGNKHIALLPLMWHLAILERRLENYARSDELVEQALALAKTLKGERHCTYATALLHKAISKYWHEDLAHAEVLTREALEIKESALGGDHLHVGLIHYDLALILGKVQLHKESVSHLGMALAVFKHHLLEDHAFTRGAQNAFNQAEDLIQEQAIQDSRNRLRSQNVQ